MKLGRTDHELIVLLTRGMVLPFFLLCRRDMGVALWSPRRETRDTTTFLPRFSASDHARHRVVTDETLDTLMESLIACTSARLARSGNDHRQATPLQNRAIARSATAHLRRQFPILSTRPPEKQATLHFLVVKRRSPLPSRRLLISLIVILP